MKITRPTQTIAAHGANEAAACSGTHPPERQAEKKARPPKLTVEISDEEAELLALYVAEHRTSLRQVIRWLIQQLPDLPGGPPLRSQSRPDRKERKSRGGPI